MITSKPKYIYIARKPCGCVVGLVNDMADKMTALGVSRFIADGLSIDRVSWEKYKSEIVNETGFMNCAHEAKQPQLFE